MAFKSSLQMLSAILPTYSQEERLMSKNSSHFFSVAIVVWIAAGLSGVVKALASGWIA